MTKSPGKGAVVVVSATPVYPCTQGNRRVIKQLLEWLRREGYVTIFLHQVSSLSQQMRCLHTSVCDEYLATTDVDDESRFAGVRLTKWLKGSSVLVAARSILRRAHHRMSASRNKVMHEANICRPETKALLKDVLSRHSCRAVIAEYHFMTPVFDVVPAGVLKIVQTHDACSQVKDAIGDQGVDTQGREISVEQERQRLKGADVIIAIQKRERDHFSRLVPERTVIEVGYSMSAPVRDEKPCGQGDHGKRILFVGGPNPMNKRGVEQFIEHAWPLVRKEHRTAQLIVAGGVCSDLSTNTCKQVELRGVLEDMEDEWCKASVVINPVDLGTGLKIKTVEAIGRGKALVTTPEGVTGLTVDDDAQAFLVADDWALFAEHVNALLSDPSLKRKYERRALDYARTHLTDDVVYSSLRQVLEEGVAPRAKKCNQDQCA
jgi:glycosyltransferase involved in cell wall biosynthesis